MIDDKYKKYHDIDYVAKISTEYGPMDVDIVFNNGHRITFSYDSTTMKKILHSQVDKDIMKKISEYEFKNRREKIEKIINKCNDSK